MSFTFARYAARVFRPAPARYISSPAVVRPARGLYRNLILGAVLGVSTCLALAHDRTIYLDSEQQETTVATKDVVEDTIVDPATSITFPKTMRVPSNTKLPPLTLIGVGVRTVSFLGVKVYSVGFYADLNNPNLKIPLNIGPEEKVKHIVENSACIVRIVPTRSTSYTHLRDAFMRALQTRLSRGIREGTITEVVAQASASPMRALKGLFPNSPLGKHVPLDIYLAAPIPNRQRPLIFRDLGSIESDWVATEFILNYFDKDGPSPPLKESVFEYLKSFQR